MEQEVKKIDRYWAIKRFKDEPIMVSPRIASAVARAKAEGKESVVIKHEGSDMLIDCRSISAVEETRDAMPSDNVYMLGDGRDGSEHPSPVLNLEGAVVTNWYKKPVSLKEWNTYYSKMATYRLLYSGADGTWMAWRRPEMYNDDRSTEGIYLCTKEEAERLWKSEMRSLGH